MPNSSPAEVAAQLRNMALTEFPNRIKTDRAYDGMSAVGVLMETGYEQAVATLAAFITGDASIYLSSGGGVIGGQGHADIRIAARRFTQFAGVHVPEMSKCTDCPLPRFGQTTFYVINANGIFTLTAPEQALGGGSHEFSPLFHAGQYVITLLRMSVQKK